MNFFKKNKKEEKPLLLVGYVEKTAKADKPVKKNKKKKDDTSLEDRAELLYGEKTEEKKNYYKPMYFESLVLNEAFEPKKLVVKAENKEKKASKEKETLKERAKKTVDDAKKQGLMFINEKKTYLGDEAYKFIKEGNFDILSKISILGKITDVTENLKMAHKDTYMDTPFAHEHTIYNNVSEVSPFLRPYVVEKIKSQLGSPALKTTKGIFIDNDKPSSIRIANNEKIQDIIRENKTELKAYGYIKKTSIHFSDFNLHNAIGRADIVDIYLHPTGEITFYLIDTYDFNKDSKNILVKAGRINQEEGNLIPYFMIYSVKIDKETVSQILN